MKKYVAVVDMKEVHKDLLMEKNPQAEIVESSSNLPTKRSHFCKMTRLIQKKNNFNLPSYPFQRRIILPH